MIVNKDNYNIELFHNCKNVIHHKLEKRDRLLNLDYACSQILSDGWVLEFGVFTALTTNQLAKNLSNKTIYGFDSFEGLPEDWFVNNKEKETHIVKRPKGHFALEELPDVEENVTLIKGFFDTSLPEWLESNTPDPIAFLHIDCDLYSSTKTVFNLLNNYIEPGAIIVFDDFYPWGRHPYELWAEGEYLALKEWIEQYNRSFEILSRTGHQQTTIRVIE